MSNNINQEQISNLDDIEFKLIKEGKLKEKNNGHYINNKELYQELVKYNQFKKEAIDRGEGIPPLTNKIGLAIIQIANRRCNSPMYRGYTNNWKEEMISNAITVATLLGHNFDPEKYNNPFAYFTQICDNAIKEQLKREKTQLYIRYKSIDNVRGRQSQRDEFNNDGLYHEENIDELYEDRLNFINQYEERNIKPRKKRNENGSEPLNTL